MILLFVGYNTTHKLQIGNFVGRGGDFIFGDEVDGVSAVPPTPCARRPNLLARDFSQMTLVCPLIRCRNS